MASVSTARALDRPSSSCHSAERSPSSTAKRAGLEPAAGTWGLLEGVVVKGKGGAGAIVADRLPENPKTQDHLSLLKIEMRLR